MNQYSSKVKTFVDGQESMLESLDEMIERYSQEQVSGCLQAILWSVVNFNWSIAQKMTFFFVIFVTIYLLYSLSFLTFVINGDGCIKFELKSKIPHNEDVFGW